MQCSCDHNSELPIHFQDSYRIMSQRNSGKPTRSEYSPLKKEQHEVSAGSATASNSSSGKPNSARKHAPLLSRLSSHLRESVTALVNATSILVEDDDDNSSPFNREIRASFHGDIPAGTIPLRTGPRLSNAAGVGKPLTKSGSSINAPLMKEKGSDEFNSDLNSVAAAIKSSSVSRNEVLVDPFTGRPTLSRRSTATSSVALDLGTPNVSRQSSVASNLGAASEKSAPSSKLQEPSTATESPPTFHGRIKAVLQAVNPGLVLMIINAVLGCFTTLFSKKLTGKPYNYQPFQLVFFRSLVVYCIGTLWQLLLEVLSRNAPSQSTTPRTRVSVLDLLLGPKGARWLLLGRASSGFVSVFTYYYSVRALSVGEATVLSFVSPIVVGILGALVLKERWEKIDAAASVISLFGVSVIANPSMLNFLTQSPVRTVRSIALAVQAVVEAEDAAARTMSFATGIVSAVAGATTYIWIRKIGKGASAMQVSTIFGLHSVWMSVLGAWAAGGSPWTVSHGVPASAGEWGYLFGLSCVGLTGQVLLNVALRFVAAAKASCMNFVQVPASFTLDFLLHGRVPSLSDCVGGGTIVSCVLMVAMAKSKRADPLPNPPPPVANSDTKSVESTAAVSDRNTAEPGKNSFIKSVPVQPQLFKQETSPPSGSIRSRTNSMARPKAVPARSVLGNADRLGLGNRAASGVSGMSRPVMRKADRSESQPLVGTLEREQAQQAKSPKAGRGAGR